MKTKLKEDYTLEDYTFVTIFQNGRYRMDYLPEIDDFCFIENHYDEHKREFV